MTAQAIHPRVSVNLVSGWQWTLDQHLDFLDGIGVGAISVTPTHLGERPATAMAAIRAKGFTVVSAGTGAGSLIDGEAETLARLTPIIDIAAALDCPTAFSITGPTPPHLPTGEACRRLIASLPAAAAYARARGVRLAIEPSSPALREHGFVNSLGDAIAVAGEAGVGVVVELQNCWYERDLENLFRSHVGRFAIVQCSDFRVGEELRMNRRVPGDGTMPLEWMIGRLLDAGYAGMFDLEMVGPAIEGEGYASAIRRGAEWLSECLTRWNV